MKEPKKILIFNNDQPMTDQLTCLFESKWYKVQVASDSNKALNILKEAPVDLIVLNLSMARCEGIEFYKMICDRSGNPQYPILIMVDRDYTKDLHEQFQFDGFLPQPYEAADVLINAELILEGRDHTHQNNMINSLNPAKGIFLVEDSQQNFNSIALSLMNGGFKLNSAKTGLHAIEKILYDQPALAIVKLNLEDISGGIVIEKLLKMTKTSDIKFILYVDESCSYDKDMYERISSRREILRSIKFTNPEQLLKAVNGVFFNCDLHQAVSV